MKLEEIIERDRYTLINSEKQEDLSQLVDKLIELGFKQFNINNEHFKYKNQLFITRSTKTFSYVDQLKNDNEGYVNIYKLEDINLETDAEILIKLLKQLESKYKSHDRH